MTDTDTISQVQSEVAGIQEQTGTTPEAVAYQPQAWTREGRAD